MFLEVNRILAIIHDRTDEALCGDHITQADDTNKQGKFIQPA